MPDGFGIEKEEVKRLPLRSKHKQCEKGNNLQMALKEWKKLYL